MMAAHDDNLQLLRAEIAALAARMIAQDGADYGSAKRKAARQLLGTEQPGANRLPDNAQIEEELRRYQTLFQGDTQPAQLQRLREIALQVMRQLAQFRPYLCGAVLNGTAGAHDDVHLQLFADSPKDVLLFLLGKDVKVDISETPHFKGGRHAAVDTVSFFWRKQAVHAQLYDLNDLRGALKPRADGRPQRADTDAVRALVDAGATPTEEQDE